MELGTIIGALVFLAIAVFSILQPFLSKGTHEMFSAQEQKKRDELLTSYERVLTTIRDLDEDYNTGKLAPDSYQTERSYWTEHGIGLLQQLEPQEETPQKAAKITQVEDDDAVEKAIAAYRKAKA